jgi:hypothetical protein
MRSLFNNTQPWKLLLALYALLFLFTGFCFAADVTLQWDSNTESDLAGYKIYYNIYSGEPYDGEDADQGPSPITVYINELDNSSNPEFTLTGLDEAETYFFAVTAYDYEELESDLSNEISFEGSNAIVSSNDNSENISSNDNSGDIMLKNAAEDSSGCFIKAISFD